VTLKVDDAAVKRALKNAPEAMNKEIVDAMRRIGVGWERHVKERFKGGGKGARGGKNLYSRTGSLRRSVGFSISKERKALLMYSGNAATPYAGIQETGGTVRPKRKKFLTIPLSTAKTASGALSGSYKIRRRANGGYETDKGRTFIYKSKRGNLLIAVKRNNRKKVDLRRDTIYVLKKSVKIKARLGAWDAARLDGARGGAIRREIDVAVIRALETI
jgi:hypothetical protein